MKKKRKKTIKYYNINNYFETFSVFIIRLEEWEEWGRLYIGVICGIIHEEVSRHNVAYKLPQCLLLHSRRAEAGVRQGCNGAQEVTFVYWVSWKGSQCRYNGLMELVKIQIFFFVFTIISLCSIS